MSTGTFRNQTECGQLFVIQKGNASRSHLPSLCGIQKHCQGGPHPYANQPLHVPETSSRGQHCPLTARFLAALRRRANINTIDLLLRCPSWRIHLHTFIRNPQTRYPGAFVVIAVMHRGVKVLSCPVCTQLKSHGVTFSLLVPAHTVNHCPFYSLLSAMLFTFGVLFGW